MVLSWKGSQSWSIQLWSLNPSGEGLDLGSQAKEGQGRVCVVGEEVLRTLRRRLDPVRHPRRPSKRPCKANKTP